MDQDGSKRRKKARRTVWWVAAGVFVLLALYFVPPIVDVYLDARREGFFDTTKQKEYDATSMENLKALWQATQLYYESEGVMPAGAAWMDELKPYIRTNDLKRGEELKKFVNPRIEPGPDVYGYAYNSALDGKYLDELPDPAKTPAIFESRETGWNAHGDPGALQPSPELPGGNKAVTADGAVALLKDLLHQGE